jgi:hypothetical protein
MAFERLQDVSKTFADEPDVRNVEIIRDMQVSSAVGATGN